MPVAALRDHFKMKTPNAEGTCAQCVDLFTRQHEWPCNECVHNPYVNGDTKRAKEISSADY